MNLTDRNQGFSGSFDGKSGTYAAEMIGDFVQMGSVTFAIGPRDAGARNSVACRGERIALQDSPFVRIVAMSIADEGHATALQAPFDDLHRDAAFQQHFDASMSASAE
jgi:hypothetical protein